eukprot:TRINITY_DN29223_c0_g1_i1.p1 TRINITY_DN29223_c0_g1~~TRINITY_DN29223_c0_g1_i1.p1  ORF type:complete len:460 (+),score=107.04 TRINITY_DN29223_c0_g1_i1:88-1380(+)
MALTAPPEPRTRFAVGDEVRAVGMIVEQRLNGVAGRVLGHRGSRQLLVDFDELGRRVIDARHLELLRAARDMPPKDLRALIEEQRNDLRGCETSFSEYRERTFRLSDRAQPAEPQSRAGEVGAIVQSFVESCCVFADIDADDGGITENDVLQKRLQDSYFVAFLTGLSCKGMGRRYLRSIVRLTEKVVVDTGGPVCEVRFLRVSAEAKSRREQQLAEWVPVTAFLPAHESKTKPGQLVPLYAKSKQRDKEGRRVLWPSLIEKAWVVYQQTLFPTHVGSGHYAFVDADGPPSDQFQAPGDGVHTTLTAAQGLLGSRGDLYRREVGSGRLPIEWEQFRRLVSREDRVVVAQYGAHCVPVVLAYAVSAKGERIVRLRDQAAPESERLTEYNWDGFATAFHSVRAVPIPAGGDINTFDFVSPHGSPRKPAGLSP